MNLFTPIQFGLINAKNRIIMAPLTRCRASIGHVPNDLMAEYYSQRASAGLIIAEATMIMEHCSSFVSEPGIYNQAQIDGWKKVTEAVHKAGGSIVLQLWHGGRTCHPILNDNRTPIGPSAIAVENSKIHTPSGKMNYTVPKAATLQDIQQVIAGFKQAAINAQLAGFDGVEIHAANGYLLDQFLRSNSNYRRDMYGGNFVNRSRLLFEVLLAVIDVWSSHYVGVRLSPLNSFNDMIDDNPIALTTFLAKELNSFNLSYVHLMRGDFSNIQQGDVISPFREFYKGALIVNMGYQKQEAMDVIANDKADAVAFGTDFIANPDLVERFKHNLPLTQADINTYYTSDKKGYTDYLPFEKENSF